FPGKRLLPPRPAERFHEFMLGDGSRIHRVAEPCDPTFNPQQLAHVPALFGSLALQQCFVDSCACLLNPSSMREVFRKQTQKRCLILGESGVAELSDGGFKSCQSAIEMATPDEQFASEDVSVSMPRIECMLFRLASQHDSVTLGGGQVASE